MGLNLRLCWKPIILVLMAGVVSGCTPFFQQRADLRIIYNQAAQYERPDRNPVIVIPGILGSKLIDEESGKVVWGAFDPQSANPKKPEGARLISLPIEDGKPLAEIRDQVRPNGVLDKVHISFFGVPLDIRAYAGILSTLGAGGYRDDAFGLGSIDYGEDHFTCFQFDYDWRRDNVENAQRLKDFMDEKRAYIQQEYKERYGIENAEVKFDVVAHSMGGLLLRYFMRYGDKDLHEIGDEPPTWDGKDYVDRAVLIATPSSGSAVSLNQLVKGYEVGKPVLPRYPPAILGTFPSIYQLLPRPRHGAYHYADDRGDFIEDIYDPQIWEEFGWGLASQDEDTIETLRALLPDEDDDETRRELALSLQERMLDRAEKFHEAIDRPAQLPEGLELFLVAGDAERTPRQVSVDRDTGDVKITGFGPGDGTVLRSSALSDERIGQVWTPTLITPIDWRSVLFLSSNHLGLTTDPAFADNVLYWLLEEPRTQAIGDHWAEQSGSAQ